MTTTIIVKNYRVVFVTINLFFLFLFKQFDLTLFLLLIQILLMRNKRAMKFVLKRIVQIVVQLFIRLPLSLIANSLFQLILGWKLKLSVTIQAFIDPHDLKVLGKGIFWKPPVWKMWSQWSLRDEVVFYSKRQWSKIASIRSVHVSSIYLIKSF